jgi:hypothetical protein
MSLNYLWWSDLCCIRIKKTLTKTPFVVMQDAADADAPAASVLLSLLMKLDRHASELFPPLLRSHS